MLKIYIAICGVGLLSADFETDSRRSSINTDFETDSRRCNISTPEFLDN
jgi:hypothetical protein